MSVSPVFRSRERGHPGMRETTEQRATRIDLAASGTAHGRGSRTLAEGQRFTTAGRTITRAAMAFVEEADSQYGDTAPAGLVLGYALGLVPLLDERIVAVRPGGDASVGHVARVGDTIRSASKTVAKRLLKEGGVIIEERTILNQRGEILQSGKLTLLVARRPAP